jgi:short-subunit dehydrogenase
MPRRAVYAGALAGIVAMSQALAAELEGTGVRVQVVCPGSMATEFHTVQGMDLSAVPRMSAQDVVNASMAALELGEVVCAPGIQDYHLLQQVFEADLEAFQGQAHSSRAAARNNARQCGGHRARRPLSPSGERRRWI